MASDSRFGYYATMEGAVLVVMAVIVGLLIYTLLKLGRSDYRLLANRMARKSRAHLEVLKPCPLCGAMLRRGETVHSVVFSGPSPRDRSSSRPEDSLAHLFGCPYCYPVNDDHPRVCPVCSARISDDGYVVARMFEKPGRKHVHVLGCTECRKRAM